MASEARKSMLHGVLLIALFSCAAFYIADFEFVKRLSFSPLIVGIVLGMLYANSLRNTPTDLGPGHQVLLQGDPQTRNHPLRLPSDFPECC